MADDLRRDGPLRASLDTSRPTATSAEPASTENRARSNPEAERPARPSELSKPSLLAVVKRAGMEFKHDNLTVLAAALTYYGILAIVPGLIVLFAVLGLLGSHTTHQLVKEVQSVAPGSSAHFVRTLISQAQADKKDAGIGAVIAIFIALWSASGYVNAFRKASNIIYSIGEGRPVWKTLPLRFPFPS
jgi:membrane protein